ncbi:MAG: hypothetical protein ACTSX4_04380 [Candidatus Helarchaeota archaeon]
MSLIDICLNCPKNCCEFLKKPRKYNLSDNCIYFSDGKCTLYTSNNWKERLENGRTLLCELFPAVIPLPRIEDDRIVIEISKNENCPQADEILNNEVEKKKIKEILKFLVSEIKSNKAVKMPWIQYIAFRKYFLENKNKKLEILFI